VLVMCGGSSERGMPVLPTFVDATPLSAFQAAAASFVSSVALVKATLPPMLARGLGSVVLVASLGDGVLAPPGSAPASALAHALVAFADSLRAEVKGYGLDVLTCFCDRTEAASVRSAAHQIVHALPDGASEIHVSPPLLTRLAVCTRWLFPALVRRWMAARAAADDAARLALHKRAMRGKLKAMSAAE
jgi:NAD(P)-dependent dehydrogenase (short-subunit alcohol dehydrogenase family)